MDCFTCINAGTCVYHNVGDGCENENGKTCINYGKCGYCVNCNEEICCEDCQFKEPANEAKGRQIKIIRVDKSIFTKGEPKGFPPTGYKINISHPAISPFYDAFHKNHNIPKIYPLSDQERFRFEKIIFKMIEAGIIVVSDENSCFADDFKNKGSSDNERIL
ncbi:MAG: hypothetical protein J5994_10710 [Ruminococcus sp.]|nr:hypothetical protein [Ruminococcus sp.]